MEGRVTKHVPLVDLCAIAAGCNELSDLHYLNYEKRCSLADKLAQLPPREEDLADWNDALDYLTDAPPEQTVSAAKERLIELLRK